MKKLLSVLILFLVCYSVVNADQKNPVKWEELAKFLPGEEIIDGFQRGEISGEQGYTPQMPVVFVDFFQSTGSEGEDYNNHKEIHLSIEISDALLNSEYAQAMLETGASSQYKSKIKDKYPAVRGKEINDFGYESCMTIFLVNKRFLISINGTGTSNLKLIDKLIDAINLEKLENLK